MVNKLQRQYGKTSNCGKPWAGAGFMLQRKKIAVAPVDSALALFHMRRSIGGLAEVSVGPLTGTSTN